MKRIWSYIAMFFVGLSAGLLIAVKTSGDKYSAYIRRIRQKGKQGSSENVHFKPVVGSNSESNRITKRERKIDRIARKNEKKKLRSLRRLEK